MVETNIEQDRPAQKPNWVDKGTLLVLTLTLIVVSFYSCQVMIANKLTRQVLDAQTRPYVGVAINGPSTTPPFDPVGGQKLSLSIAYINFGKLPADARIKRTLILTGDRLESGPDLAGIPEKREIIAPPPVGNIDNVTSPQPLTTGQVADLHNGHGGWLYFRAYITYGPYYTGVCWEWEVVPGSGGSAPTLSEFMLCKNPAVNTGN